MSQPIEANSGSLTPDIQGVIDRIPAYIPEVFKDQASTAARMVIDLDSGLVPTGPQIRKFIQQIDSSGWMNQARAKADSQFFVNSEFELPEYFDHRLALPIWLQNKYLEMHELKEPRNPLTDEEESQRNQAFSKWMDDKKFPFEDQRHGRYFYLFIPPYRTSQEGSVFKAYIEGRSLVNGLISGRVQALTEAMITEATGLYSFKLNRHERLVFYFEKEVDTHAFEKRAIDEKIQYRGPAQDVFQLKPIAPEGWLSVGIWGSNDTALTIQDRNDSDCAYELVSYSPSGFLEKYLNLCLNSGKNPAEPYKTSFIHIVDWDGIGLGREAELIQEAAKLVSYPVIYTKYRHDVRVLPDPSLPPKSPRTETSPPAKRGFSISRLIRPWR